MIGDCDVLGTGILAGGPVCWGLGFFVSGLLGWLLVMKKRVLVCSACRSTVETA